MLISRKLQNGPRFTYYLSDTQESIDENSAVWNAPFPLHFKKPPPNSTDIQVTYGDYFEGARQFIERDDFRAITTVASRSLQETIRPEDISAVHIHLEKHGAFYHPARIRIGVNQTELQFVLNVAISDAGRRTINREYSLFQKLNTDFPFQFLPKVYHLDDVCIIHKDLKMTLFMGEWLDGYYEFHISNRCADGHCKVMLWDTSQGKVELTSEQILALYQNVATILTCYYNPETFEQIFPWYHAAGDFVAKLVDSVFDMKLISVRRYGAMIQNEDVDLQSILEAMLMFLLNLTLRTRIDRMDGIGDPVWADDRAIRGTLDGFFTGLSYKKPTCPLIEPISVCFKAYASSLSKADLYDLSAAIVSTYHSNAPETLLIRNHLTDHVTHLYAAIENLK